MQEYQSPFENKLSFPHINHFIWPEIAKADTNENYTKLILQVMLKFSNRPWIKETAFISKIF